MATKQLDSKGRLSLGKNLANRIVIVDDSDATRIVVTPAVVIPEHEAWLYSNSAAHEMVKKGIDAARQGQFSTNPPDVGDYDEDADDDIG